MSEADKLKRELDRLSGELSSADRIKTENKASRLQSDLSATLKKLAEQSRKKAAAAGKSYETAVKKADSAVSEAERRGTREIGKAYAEGETAAKESRLENTYAGVKGRRADADEERERDLAARERAGIQNELGDIREEAKAEKLSAAEQRKLTLEELERELEAETAAAEDKYRQKLKDLLGDTAAKVAKERQERAEKEARDKAAALAGQNKKPAGGETSEPSEPSGLSDTDLRNISRDIVNRATYKGYTYPDLIEKEYNRLAGSGNYSASELERLKKLLML